MLLYLPRRLHPRLQPACPVLPTGLALARGRNYFISQGIKSERNEAPFSGGFKFLATLTRQLLRYAQQPNTALGLPTSLPPCPGSFLLPVGPGSAASPFPLPTPASSHFTPSFPPSFGGFVATGERRAACSCKYYSLSPPRRGSPVGAARHHRTSLPYREAGRRGFPSRFLPLCRQSSKRCFTPVE